MDVIISILKKRGFLIDYDGVNYILSDNSYIAKDCNSDNVYLNEILREFKIGYVDGDYIIHIDNMIDVDNFKVELFEKKVGQTNMESIFFANNWTRLRNSIHGYKVGVRLLEPYIALYVKAINACGLFTADSCDGNHPGVNKMGFYCSDNINSLMHIALWENCLKDKFKIKWNKEYNQIDLSEDRYNQYDMLIKTAEFLYENRIKFREIKNKSTKILSKSMVKHGYERDQELTELFLNEFSKNIVQCFCD